MLNRLDVLFQETYIQMDSELLEFNGESDHVHLMVSMAPQWTISNFVGKLKGKSSYFLRQEFTSPLKKKLWGNHLWSPRYCAVSCGGAPLEIIKKYIENQRAPTEKIHKALYGYFRG